MFGVGGGCFLFVAHLMTLNLSDSNEMQYILDNFTTYTIGYIVIGIGFFGGAIIHVAARLSLGLRLAIHIGVGVVTLIIVWIVLGQIPTDNPVTVILNLTASALIIFAVWFVCYLRDKREVQKINNALGVEKPKKNG